MAETCIAFGGYKNPIQGVGDRQLPTSDAALVETDKYRFRNWFENLAMSGSSTPLQDDIPQGPVAVSLQDIFDGIVVDACQLNILLSLAEDVNLEDEVSQDVSEGEQEGESSQSRGENSAEYEGKLARRTNKILVRLSQTQTRRLWYR